MKLFDGPRPTLIILPATADEDQAAMLVFAEFVAFRTCSDEEWLRRSANRMAKPTIFHARVAQLRGSKADFIDIDEGWRLVRLPRN